MMDYICGFTFAPFVPAGVLSTEKAKESLRTMAEQSGANFVIFVPAAYQDNATSEEIDFTSPQTLGDDELKLMIDEAHALGLGEDMADYYEHRLEYRIIFISVMFIILM